MKSPKNYQFANQSGFTLIEIMMVIAIIGILAAIATVSYQVHIRQAHLMSVYQASVGWAFSPAQTLQG